MITPKEYISLKELQSLVRLSLEERFALPVWVSSEISELKVNYSGHCYLELIEKGQNDTVPVAQSRAVIWRSRYPQIASRFETETGSRLGAGIRILARVQVTYHELYGFSLQIIDIDPAFTLGDMERRRQQTIARLQAEGVWDMNRELQLPVPIQRVAVISSANAAGFQDFCKELEKSPYRFTLTLIDAVMQGTAAEDSIVEALCHAARRLEEFDVVVIIRGGGSRSDLNCFDSYRLCNHVAQFPLPILTGIGHDKDVSVADMVANTHLKTPTAVAAWLTERMAELDGRLDYAALQLRELTGRLLHANEVRMERYSGALKQYTSSLIVRHKFRLEQMGEQLPDAVRRFLDQKRRRLDTALELIEGRRPEQILRLGFAIVRTRGGILSATQAEVGQQIEIEVADGRIGATVNHKEIWKKQQ